MANEVKIIIAADGSGVKVVTDGVAKSFVSLGQAAQQAGGKSSSALKDIDRASVAVSNLGMSAKATAAAMRGVPAQFTDIVTSLQGGQSPLTVFMQQGGQLKDMFGGAGNAAKALGGYVAGLVNPLTVGAAVVGALGVSYYQATNEVSAYTSAVALSGHASGLTVSQLQAMATSIGATTGTVGAAADALVQMAQSGFIAAENMEKFTASSMRFSKVTGAEMGDVVKSFAALANDPVSASEKLNKQYNYLTASVYEQIKALAEHGDKSGAVALAQGELSAAQHRMATEIESGLGRVDQAWNMAGKSAKWAWDQFVGLNRPDSIESTIGKLEKQLKALQGSPSLLNGNWEQKTQEELAYWKHIQASQNDYAANQKKIAQQTDAQIALDKAWESGLGKVEKANRAIAKLSGEFSNADQTPENTKKYAAAVQNILDGAKATQGQKAALSEATKGLALYNDLMATSIKVSANYTEEQAKLNAARKSGALSVDQYNAATQALVEKQPYMIAAHKDEADAIKAATKAYNEAEKEHTKYIDSLEKGLDKLTADTNAQQARNARLGLSKEAIADLDAVELQLQATKLDGLAIDELVMRHDTAAYELQKASAQQLRDKAAAIQSGAAKETSLDYAKDQQAEWKKSVQKYDDIFSKGFADMLNGGEGAWKSFTTSLKTTFKTSVADELYKMFAKPFVMKIVGSLLGLTGGGMSGLASAAGLGADGTSALTSLSAAQNLKSAYDALTTGVQANFASYIGNLTTSVLGQTAGNAAIGGALTGDITSSALAAQVSGQAAATLAGQAAYTQAITTGATEAAAQTAATQATTAALESNSATLANTGAGIGTAATAAAGIAIGTLIAGNKELFGAGGLAWSAIGAAVGTWVFPVVGTFVGAVVGGVLDAAFGQGPTEMDSSGVRGTLTNTGFSGNAYANMSQDAGWFNDGDNWTELRAVPGEISSALDTAFASTKLSIAKLAVSLGQSTDKIAGYTKYIDIAAGTSNEAINAMFIGMGDEMSAQILSNKTGQVGTFDAAYYMAQNPDVAASAAYGNSVKGFFGKIFGGGAERHFNDWGRAEGRAQNAQSMVSTGKDYTYLQREVKDDKTGVTAMETATQTLTRLSESLQGANVWLKVLDHALLSVSMEGAEAASKLSDAFGGLDKMAAANKTYYDMFWTDAEKLADTTGNVARGLALVGVAMPTSKDAFRNIVSGLDLMTDAGRSAYAVMLNLAPEFAQVADAASAAAKATADAAKATADAAKEQAAQAREQATSAAVQTIANAQLIIPADALRGAFDQADILRLFGINSFGVQDATAQTAIDASKSIEGLGAAVKNSIIRFESLSKVLDGKFNGTTLDAYLKTFRTTGMSIAESERRALPKVYRATSEYALHAQDVEGTFKQLFSYASNIQRKGVAGESFEKYKAQSMQLDGAPWWFNDGLTKLAAQRDGVSSMTRASKSDDGAGAGVGRILAVESSTRALQAASYEYQTTIRGLNQYLEQGSITQEQYAKSAAFAAEMTLKAGGALDYLSQRQASVALYYQKQAAGLSSVNYYLDNLSKSVASLNAASQAAAEPISVLAETVGRLQSASYVFGKSASAIGRSTNGDSQQKKAIANAIAGVAEDAAGWLNTQTGQAVKDQFADNPIFNGVDFQKIGPMLDSVRAWDTAGYEQAFTRLSDALGNGSISVEQYTGLMGTAKDMFLDTANTLSDAAVAASELSRLLTGALDSMQSQIAATYTDRQAAQAQIEAAIAIAGAGGPLPKADDVKDAVSLLTKNASSMFSTYEDYKRDYNRATINMSTLNNLATNKQSKTTDDVVAELVAVRKELEAVKAELIGVRAETQSTAISSHKTAKTLTRVTQDGESITTSAIV